MLQREPETPNTGHQSSCQNTLSSAAYRTPSFNNTPSQQARGNPLVLTLMVRGDAPIGMRVHEDGGLLEIVHLEPNGLATQASRPPHPAKLARHPSSHSFGGTACMCQAGLQLYDQLLAVDGVPLGGHAMHLTGLMLGKEVVNLTLSRPGGNSRIRPPRAEVEEGNILDKLLQPLRSLAAPIANICAVGCGPEQARRPEPPPSSPASRVRRSSARP